MSKYTMTIEEYCIARFAADSLAEDPDYDVRRAPIDITPEDAYLYVSTEIFSNDMAFYTTDPLIMVDFVKRWTDEFYFTEIGQETMARFRWTFRAWMNNNMEYYGALYNSQLSSIASLDPTYKKTVHDDLEKSGSEKDELDHGLTVTLTPTNRGTKNKIIPLGGASEVELNESTEVGTEETKNTGKDSTTRSFTNRWDKRTMTEEITGRTVDDQIRMTREFRDLILDINTMIFKQMRRDHLFMEVW